MHAQAKIEGCCYLVYECPSHASQEQSLGGKKRPSVVNPLSMLYIVLGTIRAKNKKDLAWKYSICSLITAKNLHF